MKTGRYETMDQCVAYLKEHGFMIGQRSQNGDQLAQAVVNVYSILSRGYRPNEVGILTAAIEAYEAARQARFKEIAQHALDWLAIPDTDWPAPVYIPRSMRP